MGTHTDTAVNVVPVGAQTVGPDTSYPALHAGWHQAPDVRKLVHVPMLPLAGAATVHAANIAGLHTVVDIRVVPVGEQSVNVDAVNPVLQAGWHHAPAARVLAHVPRLPLAGAATAQAGRSDGMATDGAADVVMQTVTLFSVTPAGEQIVGPDTEYPGLHAGWHFSAALMLLLHVPRLPLAGAITAHAWVH